MIPITSQHYHNHLHWMSLTLHLLTFHCRVLLGSAEEVPLASFFIGDRDAMAKPGVRKRYSGGVLGALSFIELRHTAWKESSDGSSRA
ncbi:unnamed protein product [Leptosia nina]|uniref:Secreted protein n=1 Tax=Leptosia nina TaxID=320188 RepID=A0AAV1JF13_9NEOP